VGKDNTDVDEYIIKKESPVAYLSDRIRRGACGAVVDDPVDEEAE
jgi:hypothetical protein